LLIFRTSRFGVLLKTPQALGVFGPGGDLVRRILLSSSLFLVLPVSAAAQVVRGQVHDQVTGLPVRGVFVVLADAKGTGRYGLLTDSTGQFIIRAPAAGSYQLTAQRLGYQTVTPTVFNLNPGEVRTIALELPVQALRLPELSARGDRRCGSDRERAVETARLWEEARKALAVAAWLESQQGAQFRVRRFEHRLNRALQPIADEIMSFMMLDGQQAFHAAPVDSLMQLGFVQRRGNEDFDFYGPDAELLTSSAFLDQHCFWVARARNRPGLIGLGFEPIRGRRVSDIRGVLWLDEHSAALRFVEYDFVNMGFSIDARFAGGRTDYQQLPNGAWLVSRWEIRMPQSGTQRNGRIYPEEVRRVGAEVLDARINALESITLVPSFAVIGTVFDSLRSEPLRGAQVSLAGTPFQATTDERGAFRIDSVPRGDYYVALSHQRLDSIPAAPVPRRVRVDSTTGSLRLATPDPARLRTALCARSVMIELAIRQQRPAELLGLVRVRVLDSRTREPLRGVTVSISWQADIPALEASGPRALQATTNGDGDALICGVPAGQPFRVLVEQRGHRWRGPERELPPERLLQITLGIQPPAS
jgi:hypothetical protein